MLEDKKNATPETKGAADKAAATKAPKEPKAKKEPKEKVNAVQKVVDSLKAGNLLSKASYQASGFVVDAKDNEKKLIRIQSPTLSALMPQLVPVGEAKKIGDEKSKKTIQLYKLKA